MSETPKPTASFRQVLEPQSLPLRPSDGHKGSFGRLGVMAGSPGMLGAAILCARAALRSGVGSVLCSLPDAQRDPFTVAVPAAMTVRRGDGSELESADAVVIGPGLGGHDLATGEGDRSESVRSELGARVGTLLGRFGDRPVVLDADGLNAISPLDDGPSATVPTLVLTPHPGEAARLLGTTTADVEADRAAAVTELVQRSGAVVVLKGARTLVGDLGRRYENRTGNDGLGTAGSGDVLAGLLGALLASGTEPFVAACQAVYLHGRAGDFVAAERSRRGLCAEDLPDALSRVLREWEA